MGYIFNPDGFDWMNIRLTKDNDYTYHHIEEVKKGGKTTVENGAILTEISHRFLHILEAYCPKAYNDLQNVFMTINARMEPPSFELMKEISAKLSKKFKFVRVDLYQLENEVRLGELTFIPMNSIFTCADKQDEITLGKDIITN